MTRAEFMKICGVFGIGCPFQFSLMSHGSVARKPFKGKVVVIGAGAGGLSAGYFLRQQGVDFEILEASLNYGGRMRISTEFTDFPIPLGAEWLETNPGIFKEIVNDASVKVAVKTVKDAPDRKFVNSSWYNFFEEYIVPHISHKISFDTIVKSIDYSGDQIVVNTQNGRHLADKVVLSVPLKILQDRDISFTPSLPKDKLKAINGSRVWEGFKAFFEFSNKFYDEQYVFNVNSKHDGEKIYYDAAYGQDTDKNILGLFVVGTPAQDFISRSGDELKEYILTELDGIYENQATPNYIKHLTQNWNQEPFIKGGYMTDHADWKVVRTLGRSVDDKLYFAGGAYTDGEEWVSVHTAARSAKKTVEEITKN
ncbi:flavin monoamine oxidase family protein [Flagellimonas flava]|uniref:Tryptophan 2-monooxygenase n=1 Tax=Flagellimonas flava TaxID=570519 RepID=A0A1M5K684_9FLAO|nr:FAD-dependent oxidoreductase [Allomuricauda flava]SHG48296.1 NAD(P)-binding Rossmann-like domain-containing protein [Allomuricauda flava]